MKKIYKLLFLLAVTMLTFACSSGYKAMKKGDYYKAVIDAVDKLRSSPRSDKAGYVLTKAYPMAVKAAERDIAAAIASNHQTAYETVVYEYERINQMANAICKKDTLKFDELTACVKEPEYGYAKYGDSPRRTNWLEHYLTLCIS